ncbi:hypothetical protein [Nostoc sp. 'Peltigera membranacea cyanobiont' 210A]|uniref:hypothetical protein n=1 Tax=Nostoc sp. 'Peltigera membranacea cyanobiont' 210A TaxID=2014529 RepID=UPI00167DA15B|nr:hypothetical protein [Nostoc sp. 'Peltigera membranacea cyanobiont' 210A]
MSITFIESQNLIIQISKPKLDFIRLRRINGHQVFFGSCDAEKAKATAVIR